MERQKLKYVVVVVLQQVLVILQEADRKSDTNINHAIT
ncbi:MAG: hypothetical protein ACI90V_013069 [Bacillariaceae sp.]|jgi:hypothetical protein